MIGQHEYPALAQLGTDRIDLRCFAVHYHDNIRLGSNLEGKGNVNLLPDLQHEMPVISDRAKLNLTGRFLRFNRVPDGVFHERLQNQIRHGRVECRRINFNFHSKPVAKTNLLDIQVASKKFDFLLQCNFLPIRTLQSQP